MTKLWKTLKFDRSGDPGMDVCNDHITIMQEKGQNTYISGEKLEEIQSSLYDQHQSQTSLGVLQCWSLTSHATLRSDESSSI